MPSALTPSDADLRDFAFTPIYRARLFGSAFHARASDAEWRAGVTLWLKSWDQVPAGSLPDDDIELCRLAELGRDSKAWRKIRAGALHGWVLCDDGRLYHQVVAEGVNEAIERKLAQRARTLKARLAAIEKRLSQTAHEGDKLSMQAERQTLLQALSQSLSQTLSQSLSQSTDPPVTGSVTEHVTATKGQGQGQGQGQGINTPVGGADAPLPVGSQATEIYRTAKSLGIAGGIVTKAIKQHGPDQVWAAIGATLKTKPADPVPYFLGALPKARGFVC